MVRDFHPSEATTRSLVWSRSLDLAPAVHLALLHRRANTPLTAPFREPIGFSRDVFYIELERRNGARGRCCPDCFKFTKLESVLTALAKWMPLHNPLHRPWWTSLMGFRLTAINGGLGGLTSHNLPGKNRLLLAFELRIRNW